MRWYEKAPFIHVIALTVILGGAFIGATATQHILRDEKKK